MREAACVSRGSGSVIRACRLGALLTMELYPWHSMRPADIDDWSGSGEALPTQARVRRFIRFSLDWGAWRLPASKGTRMNQPTQELHLEELAESVDRGAAEKQVESYAGCPDGECRDGDQEVLEKDSERQQHHAERW